MEKETVIGFIGAGNMAYALITGLLNNGYDSKILKQVILIMGYYKKERQNLISLLSQITHHS